MRAEIARMGGASAAAGIKRDSYASALNSAVQGTTSYFQLNT